MTSKIRTATDSTFKDIEHVWRGTVGGSRSTYLGFVSTFSDGTWYASRADGRAWHPVESLGRIVNASTMADAVALLAYPLSD